LFSDTEAVKAVYIFFNSEQHQVTVNFKGRFRTLTTESGAETKRGKCNFWQIQ